MHDDPTLLLVLLASAVLAYGLVSRRVERSPITGPMVFTALGVALAVSPVAPMLAPEHPAIHLLAEITLVVILFTDASRIDMAVLRRQLWLPVRLLAVGLPLGVVLGTGLGWLLLPGLGGWELALLAAVLAATDAALGQAVVEDERVPVRVRQTLNVESGLNDGLALPLVLFLAACAAAAHGIGDAPLGAAGWTGFVAAQLVLGPIVGLAVGGGIGWLLVRSVEHEWIEGSYERLAALALAVLAFGGAELLGGNGFIAAFVAGLAVGNLARPVRQHLQSFSEAEARLLAALTFVIFGAVMLPASVQRADVAGVTYSVLTLTVVRMAAVWLATWGVDHRRSTRLFLGWFGPRGVASVLFALIVLERGGPIDVERITDVVAVTVGLSVLAHGLSAAPLSAWYGRAIARLREQDPESMLPELDTCDELPTRFGTPSAA